MSIAWLVVLILGIVGIATGVRTLEYRNTATFWFLAAFWAYLVLAPWAGHVL
jgi:hypothetical protein